MNRLLLLCLGLGICISGSLAQLAAADESNPAVKFRSRATALRFSRDGQRLISAGAITNAEGNPIDKRLRVWDVRSGREFHRLPAQPIQSWTTFAWKKEVGRTLLLPDFKTMLTTWGAWEVKPVKIHSFHFEKFIEVSNGNISSLALSPDEKVLAIGVTRAVEFRDARTYRLLRRYEHGAQGTEVQFGPDSKTVVCFWRFGVGTEKQRDSNQPQVIDVATARQVSYPRWLENVRDADAFAFSADGTRYAKAKAQTIEIWSVATPGGNDFKSNTFSTSLPIVRTLQFSPDGKTLAAGGLSRTLSPVQFFHSP